MKIVYILIALSFFLKEILNFYTALHFDNLGFSGFQIGVLMATYTVTGLLFVFFIGLLSDRTATRVMVITAILMLSSFYLSLSAVEVFLYAIPVFFLGGLGMNTFNITMDGFILKEVTESKGKHIGIYSATKFIPVAIGILIGGLLMFRVGFQTLALFTGLASVCTLLFVPFVPNQQKTNESIMSYLKDFMNARVIGFSLILLVFTLHWGVEMTSYTLFLKNNLHLDYFQMGIYMSIPIVFLGLSALVFGRMTDKGLSPRALLLTSFILSGGAIVLMVLTTNPYLSMFWRVIHEIGDGAFFIFVYTGTMSFFTKQRMGGNFGLISLVMIIGGMIGSLIFGPMGDTFGYQVPHIVWGIMAVFSAGFIFLFRK